MKLFTNQHGQVTGPALGIAIAAALTWYVGHEVVKGIHALGHILHRLF